MHFERTVEVKRTKELESEFEARKKLPKQVAGLALPSYRKRPHELFLRRRMLVVIRARCTRCMLGATMPAAAAKKNAQPNRLVLEPLYLRPAKEARFPHDT